MKASAVPPRAPQAAATTEQALTAEALSRLHSMELRARTIVEGHFSGQHRSHFKGASVEFADHRNYSPGDELRHLDWKLFGRTDRFFVKQYDAETNMNVVLIVDCSGSMGYGSGPVTKLQYATYLAAGLAYLTTQQGDAPGLALVDTGLRRSLAPRTRPAHLTRILHELDQARAGGETSLAAALAETTPGLSRRGIVVLISDLLDEVEAVLRALVYFRHRGHDVIVWHVLDPVEKELPLRGPVIFEDLETGEKLLTEVDDVRRTYLREMAAFCTRLSDGCRAAGIDYAQMTTSDTFYRALSAYLARRTMVT